MSRMSRASVMILWGARLTPGRRRTDDGAFVARVEKGDNLGDKRVENPS
jgi:hypothetical protein